MQAAALEGRDGEHEVIQLHWGGGTPTFLSHGNAPADGRDAQAFQTARRRRIRSKSIRARWITKRSPCWANSASTA